MQETSEMCLCSRCKSNPDKSLFYCQNGESSYKITQNGCWCGSCNLNNTIGKKHYFCVYGIKPQLSPKIISKQQEEFIRKTKDKKSLANEKVLLLNKELSLDKDIKFFSEKCATCDEEISPSILLHGSNIVLSKLLDKGAIKKGSEKDVKHLEGKKQKINDRIERHTKLVEFEKNEQKIDVSKTEIVKEQKSREINKWPKWDDECYY